MSPVTFAIVLSFLVIIEGSATQWRNKQETGSNDTVENENCPYTWFSTKQLNNGSTVCECGSDLGYVISCDQKSKHVEIFEYYCMTYDSDNVSLIVGECYSSPKGLHDGKYPRYDLPRDPSLLDQNCGWYGRTGQLCGKCLDGYAPPVYSHHLTCVNCTDYTYSWVKYGVAAFLPLTILYIAVVVFQIRLTSGVLDVFILFSQVVSSPVLLLRYSSARSHFVIPFIISLYGILNLDFFRPLYSPFCIHPNITTLHAVALDYIIAVYPLLLIAVTYSLVELHDHDFRLIVWLWKPFRYCFGCFRREWDVKSSLIHAFSTFILLSYTKFLSVSFYLLVPIDAFKVTGEKIKMGYLLLDGSVKYFGREHLPFSILALATFLVFNVLPLVLLCLYPCRCFQRCLDHCKIRFLKLHMFMDVFQGCYKDGTAGSCDCRWFAGVYLMMRIAILVIAGIVTFNYNFGISLIVFLLQLLLFLIIVFQPYKIPIHNTINIFLLIVVSLFGVSFMAEAIVYSRTSQFRKIPAVFIAIFSFIPLMFFVGLILYKCFGHRRCTQRVFQRIHASIPCVICRRMLRSDSEESLPDRMIHAEQYVPLLAEPDTGTYY